MAYFWLKAFHIVGVVTWFAGLFYLVRLFVYHAEALEKPEPDRGVLVAQYKLMERRLFRGITTPGMIFTVAMAAGILIEEPGVLKMPWMKAKLGLVLLLVIYHLFCGEIVSLFAADRCRWRSGFFRVLNEVPTVLLVAIVLLAVFKDALPGGALIGVIVTLSLLLALGIALYARVRGAATGSSPGSGTGTQTGDGRASG